MHNTHNAKSSFSLARAVALTIFAIIVSASATARADIPPQQTCTAPGQPCTNAGVSGNQAGTCTATTCTKSIPNGDGGRSAMSYDCNLCTVAFVDAGISIDALISDSRTATGRTSGGGGAGGSKEPGTGGSANAGSGGSQASDGGTKTSNKSGCTVAPTGVAHDLPCASLLGIAFGLSWLGASRRRRGNQSGR